MQTAPIVLFVYNRPEHTKRLLDTLEKNDEISCSDLFIYCDGPKTSADAGLVDKTREVCRAFSSAKQTHLVFRDDNLGLADNIIDGVTDVVNQYGRVIVLEDDLILSPSFLKYMNSALEKYADQENVFHVSGYWHPTKENDEIPDFFFLSMGTCWGWGTWQRAWNKLELDPVILKRKIAQVDKSFIKFNLDGAGSFLNQLNNNIDRSIRTWAIKWYATIFLNDALSLHPKSSFVENLGHDGSGTNCESAKKPSWESLNTSTSFKFPEPTYCKEAEKDFVELYKPKSTVKRGKYLLQPFLNRRALLPKKVKAFKYLKKRERFKPGRLAFLGNKLEYIDGPSLFFMIKELFYTEIYKLKDTNKAPYIIDCGANIGLAVIYWKKAFPESEIVCFEPDDVVFDCLKLNMRRFNLKDVTLIKKALWSSETQLEFCSEGADGGRIKNENDEDKIIKVETDLLSKYIYKNVDLLKIDIEGAEYTVLQEIKDKLHLVDNIFVEYHSFVDQEQCLDEILSLLKSAGFRLNINSPGLASNSPFYRIKTYNSMDMQLNIYGRRS